MTVPANPAVIPPGSEVIEPRARRWFVIWLAFISGLQTLVAGTTLAGVIGDRYAGLASLVVAAALTGTAVYASVMYPGDTVVRTVMPPRLR